MNLTTLFEQTVAYRKELAYGERLFPKPNEDLSYFLTTGFVYWFQGKCFAWAKYLKAPNEYCPEVVAVSVDRKYYQTIGGNDQDGAFEWIELKPHL
ncbi:hypothetical protein FW755_09330 [Lonepinella koalarum]|uniref:hypothetical protein n=1 Tax=Lonepinella koalarum TaxID=53417 RepID=UPI0011E45DA2|nr:hypothetical protein [Lonepinella koalarum]TYG35278.1 hypothetical protein FW755_09330 [Lonepinella koalarum]